MKRFLSLLTIIILVASVGLLTGCGPEIVGTKLSESQDMSGTVAGKLTLNGSTSMTRVCQALGEAFSEKYPGVSVEKSGTGSGDAPNSVRSGIALIGDMSRDLKESENPDEFEIKQIAIDGIAIAVHKDNPVQDLTTEQIEKIFTGDITNWSELGGQDKAITTLGDQDAMESVKDKSQYSFIKLVALNLTSIAGFVQVLMLIAVIFKIVDLFTIGYFILNFMVMVVSLKNIFNDK